MPTAPIGTQRLPIPLRSTEIGGNTGNGVGILIIDHCPDSVIGRATHLDRRGGWSMCRW